MSVVALDIGTSRTKAILARWDGTILGSASTPTPSASPSPGTLEFPGDAVHAAAAGLVAGLAARHPGDPVDTLVVTSLGTAMVPLDREGAPLAAALSPADQRPGAVPGLLDEVGLPRDRWFELTGQDPRLTSFLHHWLWWRREQPAMLDRVARFRSLRGLVVDRLTGADAEDASWASRTMVMDLAADAWSGEILAAAGLSAEPLPRILPSTAAFPVRDAAAAATFGLAPDAQVVLGAMDNCCSFLGATDPAEARLVNIAGTFEHMAGVGELPATRAAAIAVGGLIHRYLLPGAFLSYSRVPVGLLLARIGEASPGGLEPLLAAIGTTPRPTAPGPVPSEPAVRARLAAGEAPAAVLQDVLEACAALLVTYADAWTAAGETAERVVAVGGGAHGPVLRLKANLLRRPMSTLASDEGAGFGALRLAVIARHGLTPAEACARFPNPVAATWAPDALDAPAPAPGPAHP
ncbi:MAG: FGGY family carbohydrate kinase [Chloroflexota bacterium]